MIDELPISGVRKAGGDTKKHIKRRFHVASSIPAEHKLFEIAAEMGFSDAMIGAERPSLEISEDAVDPRQHDVRRHFSDDFWLVIVSLEVLVSGESVAEDRRAGCDGAGDESADTVAEKFSSGARRMRRGWPSGDSSIAPMKCSLPTALRPCPPAMGSSLVR